jgi:hypothetical protein
MIRPLPPILRATAPSPRQVLVDPTGHRERRVRAAGRVGQLALIGLAGVVAWSLVASWSGSVPALLAPVGEVLDIGGTIIQSDARDASVVASPPSSTSTLAPLAAIAAAAPSRPRAASALPTRPPAVSAAPTVSPATGPLLEVAPLPGADGARTIFEPGNPSGPVAEGGGGEQAGAPSPSAQAPGPAEVSPSESAPGRAEVSPSAQAPGRADEATSVVALDATDEGGATAG